MKMYVIKWLAYNQHISSCVGRIVTVWLEYTAMLLNEKDFLDNYSYHLQ